MSLKYWILVGHTPIETDANEWAQFIGTPDRILSQTKVCDPNGAVLLVSTVFLGIDHSFTQRALMGHPEHVPDLFETMVFMQNDDPHDDDGTTIRSRSYEDAIDIHQQTVEALVAGRRP